MNMTSFFRCQWVNVCQVSVDWISSWSQLRQFFNIWIIDAFVIIIKNTRINRNEVPLQKHAGRLKSLQGLRSQKRIVALYGTFQQVKESLKSALPYRRHERDWDLIGETPKVKSWPIDVRIHIYHLFVVVHIKFVAGWYYSIAPRR